MSNEKHGTCKNALPPSSGSEGRCSVEVRVQGMAFPRYRRCSRKAVAVEDGKPVCRQHSKAAKEDRARKGDKARERNKALFYARMHKKSSQNAQGEAQPPAKDL